MRWRLLLILFIPFFAFAKKVVIYPQQSSTDGYPIALLKLAFKRSGYQDKYILSEASVNVPQGRALKLLRNKIEINVAWSITSFDRVEGLLPIKIPLFKGLFGYRLFFIRESEQAKFHRALPLKKLKKSYIAVQGNDWPDTKILRHSGFNVIGVSGWESYFSMVSKGRVDYFPRSMLEIWHEHRRYSDLNLAIEKNWALHYPVYMFFFVHPEDKELASVIESGLRKAIEDGSFEILFDSVLGESLTRSQLDKRHVIELDNPSVDSTGVYQWPSIR